MAIMNTAIPGSPYRVPPEPSRTPSIVLAALVHAGLVFFLWAGISWQNEKPVAVEAEVWDMKTQSAAAPPEPAPVRQPPKPEPEPVQPVKPPPPPPKVVEQPVAPKPPDIALERDKKQKELKARKLAEEREEKLKEEKQQKKLAEEKRELDKARKELAEQKKREQEDAADKKAEQLAKEKADKLAKTKQAAAEQAKLDKLRDAEMRRMQAQASGSGDAAKSTAPRIDTGYLASIVSKIKNTTSYAGSTDVNGNPRAVFRIEELPTGEIISVKMIKSSGLPAFDDAVEKGILKSSPLPKKKDGTVERSLEIGFSMKDLN